MSLVKDQGYYGQAEKQAKDSEGGQSQEQRAALQRRKTILIKNFLATADPHQTDTRLSLNKNRLMHWRR